MPTVRRLRADEWEAYRKLRLDALLDSPDAFGSTHAHESERADSDWMERVSSGGASPSDLPLVAADGAELVGLGWGKILPEEPEAAHLFQMWVAPAYRGQGVGRDLLKGTIGWAKTMRAEAVVLNVTCGNGPAQGLYSSAGFVPYGDPAPLRPGSSILSQRMILRFDFGALAGGCVLDRLVGESRGRGWPFTRNAWSEAAPGPVRATG